MVDLIQIEERAKTDKNIALLLDSMSYKIAFYILGFTAAFDGEPVDALILTGGMAKSDWIVPAVSKRVSPYAKIIIYKGEYEMEALAEGARRIMAGEEKAKVY